MVHGNGTCTTHRCIIIRGEKVPTLKMQWRPLIFTHRQRDLTLTIHVFDSVMIFCCVFFFSHLREVLRLWSCLHVELCHWDTSGCNPGSKHGCWVHNGRCTHLQVKGNASRTDEAEGTDHQFISEQRFQQYTQEVYNFIYSKWILQFFKCQAQF